MNKEQEELLGEAYKNYKSYMNKNLHETRWNKIIKISDNGHECSGRNYFQEEFIDEIKTDIKFAKRWGVVYEERELSYMEIEKLFNENYESLDKEGLDQLSALIATDIITPKRIISITYNNETIESYE